MRAERFGIVTKESEEAKKLERMKRFGVPTDTDMASKKAARLARFVSNVDVPSAKDVTASRLERFGAVDPADLKSKHHSKKRDKKFASKKGGQGKKFRGMKRQKLH